MSEYQYYEFVALDGPISDQGLHLARSCSSRAEVSRLRWRNTYNYGQFGGSVEALLRHYDAHFYIANWGSVRFGLAFPENALELERVRPYLQGEETEHASLTLQKTKGRSILWWDRHDEMGFGFVEGEGALDALAWIRQSLLQGDDRALFLGWLACYNPDEWQDPRDSAVTVPPVPPGLAALTPALEKLIEFFPVDADALSAAQALSPQGEAARIPLEVALDKLSATETKALLGRVAAGDGARVLSELNRLTVPSGGLRDETSLSCIAFAKQVLAARAARMAREDEAKAEKQRRDAATRKQRLEALLARADAIWSGLDALMDKRVAAAYDLVMKQVRDLRDAYRQGGQDAVFNAKLAAFREKYHRRFAMMQRLEGLAKAL